MHKEKQKIDVSEISKIISEKKLYESTIGDRFDNKVRKRTYEMLNKLFLPGKSDITWKKRFLYPEVVIPQNHLEIYVKAMEEILIHSVQIGVDEKQDELLKLEEKIATTKAKIILWKQFIKQYEDGKA